MSGNELAHLPHGPEFRFLDRISSLTPGKEGTGEYRVRGDEPFLRGHFPGDPIFPGVLLVEAAAQLAGVVAQSDPAIPALPGLKLAALRAAKITGAARPGDMICLTARVTGRLDNLIQAEASARVGDKTVLTAQLTLSGEPGSAGGAGNLAARPGAQ
jgi:3-hydroxyacyl-[acyl-carrier-protein] dehydratase